MQRPAPDALPRSPLDRLPLLLVPALALLALPLMGSFSTWVTLTVAGLAMGMIIFIIASGLTLVFGLMDVLNFGHGVFIALGAFVAVSVLGAHERTGPQRQPRPQPAARCCPRCWWRWLAAGVLGFAFERVIIRPRVWPAPEADHDHHGRDDRRRGTDQGHLGPADHPAAAARALRGSLLLGEAAVEKYRLIAVVIGLVVFAAMFWVLNRTKVGLLIRAGVQDREMVESLGYRIRRLFVGVFVAGSALAGLGGVMWGLYQQNVTPQMGAQVNVLIFIVIIIGGLGSVRRLLHRRAAGRAAGQLHRLSRAEGRAVLQHPADGADPAVAAAGLLPGGAMP